MKRKLINILGILSFSFGLLLAVIGFILLVTGKTSVAGIFAIPALALLIAGSNLRTYGTEA
jgi:hypothetical protein